MNALQPVARARQVPAAFLALVLTGPHGSPAAADPVPGIAYDEIARVVQAGATPPLIGSFQDDAAVIAALPPLVVPNEHALDFSAVVLLALIPGVASQWAAKAAGAIEVKAHVAELNRQKEAFSNGRTVRQRTGVLANFAYYHDWSRIELSPGHTTIDKPDQGLTMTLDAANETYKSVRTNPIGKTFTVISAAAAGTAILDGVPTVERLPAAQVEGLAVRGYRTSGSVTVTRASFACAVGLHHVTETEYVSDLTDPHYDSAQDASNTQSLVTACTLGSSVSHREPGRFVLYRVVMVDEDTPAAFGIALERGNIRTLGEQDTALFQPPPGFTEKP